MKQFTAAIAAATILGACSGGGGTGNTGQAGNTSTSTAGNAGGAEQNGAAAAGVQQLLRGPDGSPRGTVTVAQTAQGVMVRVVASPLPQGAHGVHVHAVGRCDTPDFKSAGSHWNPTNKQHGTQNPQGPHMGDLPNLMIAGEGTGTVEFTLAGAQLRGGEQAMIDADGASVIVHATADDYRTDPSGNSGDRIACAVIG